MTSERESSDLLATRVDQFAGDLTSMIEGVLPDVDGRFVVLAAAQPVERLTLRQRNRSGFVLRVDGAPLLRLVVTYRLDWNASGSYLAVEKSQFKVFLEGSSVPLLRFDYLRHPATTIPSAHVNVHAHRDEVVFAMMRAGYRDRGREHSRVIAEGRVPSLRELHIPLGGHRFRPCLEDVVQMLILEFGLDRQDGFQDVLNEGRRQWRVQQLRTAASDDLEAVADLLRSEGYTVTPPAIAPRQRIDRLTAY